MLEETRDQDFSALVKRWRGHCGRIVGHLALLVAQVRRFCRRDTMIAVRCVEVCV